MLVRFYHVDIVIANADHKQFGLQTRIATESVSLCMLMKS